MSSVFEAKIQQIDGSFMAKGGRNYKSWKLREKLTNLLGVAYSVNRRSWKVVKGRNTTVVAIRLPDEVVKELQRRADKEGMGHTVLARRWIRQKCGFPPK